MIGTLASGASRTVQESTAVRIAVADLAGTIGSGPPNGVVEQESRSPEEPRVGELLVIGRNRLRAPYSS
jgi:hypothetical protein